MNLRGNSLKFLRVCHLPPNLLNPPRSPVLMEREREARRIEGGWGRGPVSLDVGKGFPPSLRIFKSKKIKSKKPSRTSLTLPFTSCHLSVNPSHCSIFYYLVVSTGRPFCHNKPNSTIFFFSPVVNICLRLRGPFIPYPLIRDVVIIWTLFFFALKAIQQPTDDFPPIL